MHYVVDSMVRLLKLHGHGAHDAMDICCMCLECVGGGLYTYVRVEVNIVGEGGEFVIHCLGKFLKGFGEELFRYK